MANCHGRGLVPRQSAATRKLRKLAKLIQAASRARYRPRTAGGTRAVIQGSQVLTGLPQLRPLERDVSGGVAVWAHVGGFVAGAVLVHLFRNVEYVRRRKVGADAKVVWS